MRLRVRGSPGRKQVNKIMTISMLIEMVIKESLAYKDLFDCAPLLSLFLPRASFYSIVFLLLLC